MGKKIATKPGSYQVTEAGGDDWRNVDAETAERAGEVWAEANWRPTDGGTTLELDVKDPDGKLFAVSVDVDYQVSFFGMASPHPCGDEP